MKGVFKYFKNQLNFAICHIFKLFENEKEINARQVTMYKWL